MSTPVWLVTGAGSGVGRTLAVALASRGVKVLLTARNRQRLEDIALWCGALAEVLPADLADPPSVDALGRAVVKILEGRSLAGIIHAAGVMSWDSPDTPSGWSRIPLVNALSPWRLTLALEASLLAEAGARVLFVAGAPFTLSGVRPHLEGWKGNQKGRGMNLALEAASAKVFFARELQRRWAERASAFAFHPGFVKSSLADGLPFPLSFLGCVAQPFLAARCLTGEFLALDPEAPPLGGHLVSHRRAVSDCPFPEDARTESAWVATLPV